MTIHAVLSPLDIFVEIHPEGAIADERSQPRIVDVEIRAVAAVKLPAEFAARPEAANIGARLKSAPRRETVAHPQTDYGIDPPQCACAEHAFAVDDRHAQLR